MQPQCDRERSLDLPVEKLPPGWQSRRSNPRSWHPIHPTHPIPNRQTHQQPTLLCAPLHLCPYSLEVSRVNASSFQHPHRQASKLLCCATHRDAHELLAYLLKDIVEECSRVL
jgi:hypothetical protein